MDVNGLDAFNLEQLEGSPLPFDSLYKPNGAVIFLVRRMG
jgi:hypothetical protein